MTPIEEAQLQDTLARADEAIEKINASNGPMAFPLTKTMGYVIDSVPPDLLALIDHDMDELVLDYTMSKHNTLAGNIEVQVTFPIDPEIEKYLHWLCTQYFEAFPEFKEKMNNTAGVDKNTIPELEVFSLWANRMFPHDFNPPHTHSGLLSFVIWYKTPYTVEEQIKFSPCMRVDDGNLAGAFQFLHPDSDGGITQTIIRADRKYDGKICIFPSNLHHTVYPFYGDGVRISIAGNVRIKPHAL